MKAYPDLEVTIDRSADAAEHRYQVDMAFNDPDRDVPINPLTDGPAEVLLDPVELLPLETNPTAYGQKLCEMLFTDPVKRGGGRGGGDVEARELRLRLRLRIRAKANALHVIRWETLADPLAADKALMTSQAVLFSRFIESSDFRRTDSRPRDEQRALIVVANPTDLESRNFAPINVEFGIDQARLALGDGVEATVLAENGQATLDNIFKHLREGYDILYLVAHGRLTKSGEPFLVLENEDGEAVQESGTQLIEEFYSMWQRPRLIVLAACKTGGDGVLQTDEAALTALGPRLAREGIPAVLAMQGEISVETADEFMQSFFRALKEEEEIDTAAAIARNQVRERHDWWRPVLYMRSRSGRMSWYSAGFSPGDDGFNWNVLVSRLRRNEADITPFVGVGLSEALFGTRRQLAQDWSEEESDFPLAPHDRDDLPQVSQYKVIENDRDYLVSEFVSYLCQNFRKRHERYLSEKHLQTRIEGLGEDELVGFLNELIKAVWEEHHALNPDDPYLALARQNIPIYITTAPGDLLTTALKLEGKRPRVNYCPWRGDEFYIEALDDKETVEPLEDGEPPTVEEPLVYHLFGGLRDAESLVLTEDDYFDYLIGITRHSELIPARVRKAMNSQTMLILGLPFESWESRILFRMLMNQESARWQKKKNVAAQVAPTKPDVRDDKLARKYLETYFGQGSISIFWGKPEDFIRQLNKQLKADNS
jgi:hypothetical protein